MVALKEYYWRVTVSPPIAEHRLNEAFTNDLAAEKNYTASEAFSCILHFWTFYHLYSCMAGRSVTGFLKVEGGREIRLFEGLYFMGSNAFIASSLECSVEDVKRMRRWRRYYIRVFMASRFRGLSGTEISSDEE